MTDEEKERFLEISKRIGYKVGTYCNDEEIEVFKKFLEDYKYKNNLIEKQQEEIEKKDKRISDLEFALMDMVLQFANENEDSINTIGLSALEIAFNELDFDNPMSIKEVHERYKKLAQKYYE